MRPIVHGIRLSVVIPTYNRSRVLATAIDSVLAGITADVTAEIEIVVVDDGSTDETPDLLGSYEPGRILCVRQPNRGVSAARNTGVAASSAPFVTFLDSDDEALAGWLTAMSGAARRGCDVFSCGAIYRYPEGVTKSFIPRRLGPAFGDLTAQFLAGTFMVRRTLFDEAGGYREGLRFSENTDLGMRIGSIAERRRLRVDATGSQLLQVNARHRPYDAALQYETSEILLPALAEQLAKDRKLLATYCDIAGVAASRLGLHGEASTMLRRSIRTDPLNWRHWARLGRASAHSMSHRSGERR